MLLILCTVCLILIASYYCLIGVLLVPKYFYISYRLLRLIFTSMYIWFMLVNILYLTARLSISIIYTFYFISSIYITLLP